MQQIITMKRHIYNSCYSGITTLQAISEGIAKLTGPKLGQQLLKVFEPIVKPPIESMGKLEASYKQHCDFDMRRSTWSRTWRAIITV